jgi:FkbM family methyltransferase
MHYDFIEIGSCDFDTLTQSAKLERGIVVEPIKEYLDNLPDKQNVIKINAAISPDNTEGEADFYYVPSQVIKDNNLRDWLRGCNTLDQMHVQHKIHELQEHVKVIKVKKIPLGKLLDEHDVTSIGHLKIDIEGRDTELLHNFIPHLNSKPKQCWPKRITFETNELTISQYIDKVCNIYGAMGYTAIKRTYNDNTVLTL